MSNALRVRVFDFVIAVLILCGASLFATWYLQNCTQFPARSTDRTWLTPSVMMCTEYGFVYASPETIPGLQKFTAGESDTFALENVPPDLKPSDVPNLHRVQLYLMSTLGYWWRFFGISWRATAPLYGVLAGISVTLLYGVFRLGLNRFLSLLGTAAFLVYPVHLSAMSFVRDYPKAPFIMAVLLILGYLVKKPVRSVRLLTLAAVLGLVVGIGLGFRPDLLVCLYGGVFVMLFCLPGKLTAQIPLKLAAIAVMALVFFIPARPILRAMSEGQFQGHHTMQGLAPEFDTNLGVGGVPYTPVLNYADPFTYYVASSYGHRNLGIQGLIPYGSPEYGVSTGHFLFAYALNFPADIILRVYASLLRLLQTAPLEIDSTSPTPASDSLLLTLADYLRPILLHLARFGPLYAVIALAMVVARDVQLATKGLLFVLFFAAYPAMQYHMRHYFHLTFLSFWFFAFVWQHIVRAVIQLRDEQARLDLRQTLLKPTTWWALPIQRVVIFGVAACGAVFISLAMARMYQAYRTERMFQTYASADFERLNTEEWGAQASNPYLRLIKPKGRFNPRNRAPVEQDQETRTEYLMVELTAPAGKAFLLPRYKAIQEFNNLLKWMLVNPGDPAVEGVTRYFFPVYESIADGPWGERRFEGIVFDPRNTNLLGLYRVRDLRPFPFLFWFTLSPDSSKRQRFQTLRQHPIPLYLRQRWRLGRNLAPNGSFQEWSQDGRCPIGFTEPESCSTLQKVELDEGRKIEGVRQTWSKGDGMMSFTKKFSCVLADLKPDTTYDLSVVCNNTSDASVIFDAWQPVGTAPAQRWYRVTDKTVQIGPHQKLECAAQITTLPGPKRPVLLVSSVPQSTPQECYPVTVIWNEWRVTEPR